MKQRPKRIFLCGPISGTHLEFLDNVKEALEISSFLISHNFGVFCPHLDFLFHFTPVKLTIENYRNYCLPWLEVSDLVLLIKPSQNSGVINEINKAKELNIPIIEGLENFKKEYENDFIF